MPYNIYDNRGNKVGQVTSTSEEIAGVILGIILAIAAAPFIIAILLGVAVYQGITQVYWPWARTVHHLTPYGNLNGIITSIAIPLIAFIIAAPWERILKGKVKVSEAFLQMAALAYSAIVIVSMIPVVAPAVFEMEVKPYEVYRWLWIAPFAASSLTYLRFRIVRIVLGLLIGIPLVILGLIIVGAIIWYLGVHLGGSIINWLLS